MDGHDLLLAFDSNVPEFARGFEAGRVWAQLRAEPDEPLSELVHSSNAEILIRMAEATGREFAAELIDETWIEIHFAPAGKPATFGAAGAE